MLNYTPNVVWQSTSNVTRYSEAIEYKMLQKVFIICGLNWISFSNGIVYSQMTSMISSLQKREEGIDLTDGQISMIATAMIISGIIGFGLVAAITDKFGRRWAFIFFSIPIVINYIILYYAREMYQFILSRIIGGSSVAALVVLNIFVPSEYISPKRRGFLLNMVTTVAPAIGSALVHGLGIVLHWRTVTIIGAVVGVLGIILPYFWVESPHWLASKGRFQECETAFRIIHGRRPNAERELQLLIRLESCKLRKASETNRITTLKRLSVAFTRKYFLKLLLLNVVLNIYYAAAGKFAFSVLATVILEEVTGTSDVLLFTLLVDGFIIIGSLLSCVLIRKNTLRTLLFSCGFADCAILGLFSISYYFKNGQSYFNWINVTLLAVYFIIANAGPYPVIEVIYSEMFPLELKVYMFFISGFVLILVLSLTIVLLPYTVNTIGYHGLFIINASVMCICLGYVWLTLPETKLRTLQEIEMYNKTNNFDVNEELNKEEINNLV